ncbi:hypothetical protein HYU22_02735 [Candidatus Woesearchaeota archaeon]|nr:hypothetical protein [Candidatus Woesearchaeota archaeon]
MELMERLGGLGKVKVEGEEERTLQEILRLTSSRYNDALRCSGYEDDKRVFQEAMQKLFPVFPLRKNMHGAFDVFERENTYEGLDSSREHVIESSLPISGEVGRQEVELRIILPVKEPETVMTIAFHSLYQRSTDDDLVDMLGLRENPSIVGAAPIHVNDTHKPTRYGIADVPALGKVLQEYERARERIQKVYTHTGITPDQLNVLRRDSLLHENIAIRELSGTRYRNVLNTLAIKR